MAHQIYRHEDRTGDLLTVSVLEYPDGPEFAFTSYNSELIRTVMVILPLDEVVKLLSALRIEVDVALRPHDPDEDN